MLLFLAINKDAVTSPANQQYFTLTLVYSLIFFFILFNIGLLLTCLLISFHFAYIYIFYFPDLGASFYKPLGFDSSDIPLPAYHSSNYLDILYLMWQNKQTELD